MRSQLRHSFLDGALDWKRFGQMLFERFEQRDLSFRTCAHAIGLPNHITLYRSCCGDPVSADTYLFLCKEFGIDPLKAFTMPERPAADASE